MIENAYIVAAARTAVGKAKRGALRQTRPDDLGAVALSGAAQQVPRLEPEMIDDVIVGCAFPEAEQGMNIARVIAQRAGLPDSVPGVTVNRFCASGLQAIAMAAQAIATGQARVVVAGGAESMSLVEMGGTHALPNPALAAGQPAVYMTMGNTAEQVADRYSVSRLEQDEFASVSHERALDAIGAGRFDDEIVTVPVRCVDYVDGTAQAREIPFSVDECPRPGSTPEVLAALPAVFRRGGSVTAGNASPMSDGAAMTIVADAHTVAELGLEPLGRIVGFAVAGVAPDVMGIGPVAAIPKVLSQVGIGLDDIGLIELNEAFAAQSLAVIREMNLDRELVNVNGGAIALGHPLGCTGAKLATTLLYEMRRRDVRYGLCTMCIGGGMGAAAVFERGNS